MKQIKKLFEPIEIGGVEVKNRTVMLAMGTGLSRDEVNDRLYNYYVERAKGETGLIIVPFRLVYGEMRLIPGVYDDSFVPGLQRLAKGIHEHGSKTAGQLIITYRWGKGKGPVELVGPSEVPNRVLGNRMMRALSVEEIKQIEEEYTKGARRIKEAGFDMLEIHAGMGFLINRFLSPLTNKRQDQYGGSLENRMRFLTEIIEKVKGVVGSKYPIICRLTGDEFMPGGYNLDEFKKMVPILEERGVDLLDIQAGWEEAPRPLTYMSVPRGAFVYLAAEVKKVTRLPVVAAYRINDPFLAEQIVAEGKADLIGMARQMLADPYFAAKAREGKFDEIMPCTACNHCLDCMFEVVTERKEEAEVECTVNPCLGKEAEYVLTPADKPKKVFVVGGGPGGMEAARVAAVRGHKVTLFDDKDKLGGQAIAASMAPYKDELRNLIRVLATRVKKAGVEVKLNTKVTPQSIQGGKPDAVILATGATEIIPDIPGVNGKNVVKATEVLLGLKETGEKAIIIGGGIIGCEVAEFLVQKGKKVTILEASPRVGADLGLTVRWIITGSLREAGVEMRTNTKAVEITSKGVVAEHDGAREVLEADSVVLAMGLKANKKLAEELKGKVSQLYEIGDCAAPRRILQAMHEGFKAAREI